ncbi:hypothetical protein [Endozoicomonas euniceicola]|uniref:Uncharacterized protein n=1 Tax=Endozoicomonas euniceicola TaxID=1234143 RepID=A0ABY6GXD4_9GAMM|nr:hypothetical protein [Endozoicomonas euniceicola]UYM16721.1 hypothetical protein NX720_01955 [Endozoicomonas euniceicola]
MQKLIGICLCFISLSFFSCIKASASDYHLFFDEENTHLDSGIISLIRVEPGGQRLFKSIDLNYFGYEGLVNAGIENMYILRRDSRLSILIIPRSEHRYKTVAWEMFHEQLDLTLRQVEILRYHQDSQEQDYIDLRDPEMNNSDRFTARIVHNYRDPEDRGYPRRQGRWQYPDWQQELPCSGPCQPIRRFSY